LTTSLDWLAEESGIRVNCLVPDWIASPPVKAFFELLTAEQRRERGAPDVLTTSEEIADTVVRLVRDESLAGRVLVCWSGQPRRLIPHGDPGTSANGCVHAADGRRAISTRRARGVIAWRGG
jgi:NAD(P)-dependent dehydrogenase (short-subunit alcohol dehydrogenase family)